LPFIRSLLTVYLYCHFGADDGTDTTPVAVTILIESDGHIASGVHFAVKSNHSLGAECQANLASFAKLLVNFNVSLH